MLTPFPGIPEAGLLCHRLAAGVVGMAGDLCVLRPVRHQAKESWQGFVRWHSFITDIGVGLTPDEPAQIPGPHIELAHVKGRLHVEVSDVLVPFLEGLIVAAHSQMLTGLSSP